MKPFAKVVQSLLSSDPTAVAQAVERLSPAEAEEVLRDLSANELASVIERLDSSAAVQLLEHLPVQTRAAAVAEMPPRAAALLLRRLNETALAETLQNIEAEVAERFRGALKYPADTAGGIMDATGHDAIW